MNSLNIESDREMVKRRDSSVRVSTERIACVDIQRDGMATYTIYTTRDIESFKRTFPLAEFAWLGGNWKLVNGPVRDLQGAVIKIRD